MLLNVGGIQALLRLARSRASDQELQYKAALSVGQLASNAVRLAPSHPHSPQARNKPERKTQSPVFFDHETSPNINEHKKVYNLDAEEKTIFYGENTDEIGTSLQLSRRKARDETRDYLDKAVSKMR